MVNYNGTVHVTRDYIVNADDEDQAREFIFDLADEAFEAADTIVVKDIVEIK